jgi:hypothetical protein
MNPSAPRATTPEATYPSSVTRATVARNPAPGIGSDSQPSTQRNAITQM